MQMVLFCLLKISWLFYTKFICYLFIVLFNLPFNYARDSTELKTNRNALLSSTCVSFTYQSAHIHFKKPHRLELRLNSFEMEKLHQFSFNHLQILEITMLNLIFWTLLVRSTFWTNLENTMICARINA